MTDSPRGGNCVCRLRGLSFLAHARQEGQLPPIQEKSLMSPPSAESSTPRAQHPNQLSSVLLGEGEEGSLVDFLRDFEAVQRTVEEALVPHVGRDQSTTSRG